MKILLDIQKVKGHFTFKGPIKVKFKIGGETTVISQPAYYNENTYGFFQKHMLKIQNSNEQFYVQVIIIAQSGLVLAQIMVFFNKFKQLNKLRMHEGEDIYYLSYALNVIGQFNEQELPELKRKETSILNESANMNSQSGKLQILKFGILFFSFAQRLDPLVYLYHSCLNLVTWKKPIYTVIFGLALTFAIYHLNISILVCGLLLFFGRGWIFKKISSIHRYRNIHERLMIPEENAVFVQNGMKNYCQLYANLSQFLFNDDKTLLINFIHLICRMGLFLVILLFIFGVQHLLVISVWTMLILTSPFRNIIMTTLKPIINFLLGESSKIIDIITKGLYTITSVLKSSRTYEKPNKSIEFYCYHYERWWLFKGWQNQTKKYSDEDYECILIMKDRAPQGYIWIQEWKLCFEENMDSDGYQYANDIKTQFTADPMMATRRRRKWKRMCVKNQEALVL